MFKEKQNILNTLHQQTVTKCLQKKKKLHGKIVDKIKFIIYSRQQFRIMEALRSVAPEVARELKGN